MNGPERSRRTTGAVGAATSPQDDAQAVDQDTGEILSGHGEASAHEGPANAGTQAGTVQGERAIPSVNRERSIQSRVSGILALATIALLGAGFLFWYYTTQYAKTRNAEESTRKAAVARAAGETKVPPLGRIDPPIARAAEVSPPSLAALPLPAPATTANGGPPAKTPEQLALERQLGAPVLRRAQPASAGSAAIPSPAGTFTAMPQAPGTTSLATAPGVAQWLGALQAPAAAAPGGSNLAAMLKPTPTPAVTAQLLPTRRLLLPKGAFIDCTLETAIDSTYEGMTT
ncbi:conjugal transfer protein TrbI, partial [Variovorax sp. J31P216]|nr:conjugal transfer protein TrbI [Variovorax sp. J31P216]